MKRTFKQLNKEFFESILFKKQQCDLIKAFSNATSVLKHYDATFSMISAPFLIGEADYKSLCKASDTLLQAQSKILTFLLNQYTQTEILSMFNLDDRISPLVNWTNLSEAKHLIARFDIIPTKHGYKFCEMNIDTTLGGWKLCESMQTFCETSKLSIAKHTTSPSVLLGKYLERLVTKHQYQCVVIFALDQYIREGSGSVIGLQKVLSNILGSEVLVVTEKNYHFYMNVLSSSKVLVYRMAMYDDIEDIEGVKELFNSSNIVINKFETEILSDKSWFEKFTNQTYQSLLNDEEIRTIEKYVPTTRKVSRESVRYFSDRKEEYVFKLGRSYGGSGVIVGKEEDTNAIIPLFESSNNWLAQKYIEADTLYVPDNLYEDLVPHKSVLGLFNIDGKKSGMMMRVATTSDVINVCYGAKLGWAFPIEENGQKILT